MQRHLHASTSLLLALIAIFGVQCSHAQLKKLTRKVMDMTVLASQVSAVTYSTTAAKDFAARNPVAGSSRSGLYVNEPDVAVAARVGDTCIMAFRGTSTDVSLPTWQQDYDTNLQQDQVSLLGKCTVTEGIYNAYNAMFRTDLENDVKRCMSSCPNCKLLITGHSQGGAIANAAGVMFESQGYSPYVITFGQPSVLGSNCRVRARKWFRFILAMPGPFRLQYDPVPMIGGSGTFYGHEIVVSSGDMTGVDYVGLNTHVNKYPWNIAAHFSDLYVAVLKALGANGSSVPTKGFAKNAQCSVGTECRSGSCAWNWSRAAYECA
ncbi:hypothetical protein MPSEU_000617800 [Mayamaea pseudoterrestris]|nr:hypothetical protein MPSEU_000617800 [Mayamaea pseudoterrestris]